MRFSWLSHQSPSFPIQWSNLHIKSNIKYQKIYTKHFISSPIQCFREKYLYHNVCMLFDWHIFFKDKVSSCPISLETRPIKNKNEQHGHFSIRCAQRGLHVRWVRCPAQAMISSDFIYCMPNSQIQSPRHVGFLFPTPETKINKFNKHIINNSVSFGVIYSKGIN